MKKIFYNLVILISLISCKSYSANNNYSGELSIIVKNLPRFEDYAVKSEIITKIAPIDLSSHENAKNYRTVLTEGLAKAKQPNFAGKYVIIQNGCGSPCTMNWIVNAVTGKIVDQFGTPGSDILYNVNSSLIISNIHRADHKGANLPYIINNKEDVGISDVIDFYVLEKNKIHRILEIDPSGLFPDFEDNHY